MKRILCDRKLVIDSEGERLNLHPSEVEKYNKEHPDSQSKIIECGGIISRDEDGEHFSCELCGAIYSD